MIRDYALEKLQALSGLLAAGLWEEPAEDLDSQIPPGKYMVFKEAQTRMNNLPQTIAELT